jgi:hypothetical protein
MDDGVLTGYDEWETHDARASTRASCEAAEGFTGRLLHALP